MEKEPICVLCQGKLVREQGVSVQTGGGSVIAYTLAWVCQNCSAAFPIATGKGGVIRKPRPLYEDGERIK